MIFIRPRIHICKASIADQLDPSLPRRVGMFFLLRHSWLSKNEKQSKYNYNYSGHIETREKAVI